MAKTELRALLNELDKKEKSLRNLVMGTLDDGREIYRGSELKNEDYDLTISFLLCLYYKRIISFYDGWCAEDIEHCIQISGHPNKELILSIWRELKGKYPYIDDYVRVLSSYELTSYTTEDEEKELGNWVKDKCLFDGFFISSGIEDNSIYEIISRCEKQLGLNINAGNLLVSTNSFNFTREVLSTCNRKCSCTFYTDSSKLKFSLSILSSLLDCFSNVHFVEAKGKLFPSTGNYDGVILQGTEKRNTIMLSNPFRITKHGGFAIIYNYDKECPLEHDFIEYEVPLMVDSWDYNIVVVKNLKDSDSIVRYGRYHASSEFDCAYWIEKMSESIKNHIQTAHYQELKKADFVHNKSLKFEKVKRLLDQTNFVWRKKSDIISINDDCEEWLNNANIDESKIINPNNLSKDPFRITVDTKYNLPNFVNKNSEHTHILAECELERDGYGYSYSIPEKYADVFRKIYSYDGKIESETEKLFDRSLCCRIVKSPCLLYSAGRFLRVDASVTNPICIRKCDFVFNDDVYDIMCCSVCDIVQINPKYDENFIIYQLLNQEDSFNKDYLLVAPTREEQHTYFLSKRLDYISKLQPIVDEIEEEVRKSISESPARITAAGFSNFRRFSKWFSLPLGGVNIFVGGNNAGKSTFVKGLLLTLDNLKNLLIESDNSVINPKFQLDANEMHDVHIGTFNRAYSYFAEVNPENPSRRLMTFSISCAHFEVSLYLVPTDEGDTPFVSIANIIVHDKKRDATFSFDFENMYTSARFKIGNEVVDYRYSGLSFNSQKTGDNIIPTLIRGLIPSDKSNHSPFVPKEQTEKIKGKSGFILEIADELERVIKNVGVEYIYAHGVTQKVLFNFNDKNDYMAQTLHDLLSEKIGDVEREFICSWLDKFGIGTDYDVHTIGGEAYIIQVKKDNGAMVYLADMGMGSNQLVILILRLAIIIHKQRMRGDNTYKPTIIIEEPEQNMHPEFQSKLATLFYEVNKAYGFNFIVETHSEYLVRRSQVIVAEQKYADINELAENNPFKVYYFPTDDNPYEMLYRTDGNFSNEFGKGFYDEANNLLFAIL
jgi:hypothetical protein